MLTPFFSTPHTGVHVGASLWRAAMLFGHRKVLTRGPYNVFPVAISVGRLNLAPIIDPDRVILARGSSTAYSIPEASWQTLAVVSIPC
jgi:hypothetical protein